MLESRYPAQAISAALLPAFAARAFGAETGSILGEVAVSAPTREQNVQDVGISIRAFTEDQLAALGVFSSFDVAAFTPGVRIGGALAGHNSQFTIRGVVHNDCNDIVAVAASIAHAASSDSKRPDRTPRRAGRCPPPSSAARAPDQRRPYTTSRACNVQSDNRWLSCARNACRPT